METEILYPFGQNGQIPSGYPIADDLETDSAQQALAARQGVKLKDRADNTLTPINISSMGVFLGVLVTGGSWSASQTNHGSVQLPVKPGQKYRIVGNASHYSYYAFFSAVSFWSESGTPNYAPGYSDRSAIGIGKEIDVTIPDGCNFLYICITNGGQDQMPQSVSLIEEKVEAAREDDEEMLSLLKGSPVEYCNYSTDSFAFTGTSAQGKIEKVGTAGYRITNIASTAGKFFLYELPEGLTDGQNYQLQFDFKSWLSANWAFGIVDYNGTAYPGPSRSINIPASGSGHISYNFTYYNGDRYLRLASVSVSAGSMVLIENLSITARNRPLSTILIALDYAEKRPIGGTFNPYYGRKIDLTERQYAFASYMSSMPSHQSSACYGDYMITFSDKMSTMKMYNLRTKTLLATTTQTAKDSFHHCNQAFFGTEKYDEGDYFPLCYLTVNNNGTTAGGYMEVYRIVPTMGASDFNAFAVTLVQTVTLPIMSAENALGNANFVLDSRSGSLYTYSRNNNSEESNYMNLRITRWNMPKLSQGDITLTDADIKESWETGTKAANAQGAAIKNHLLFIFRGYESAGYIYLYVFDLVQKTRVATIDILSDGFTSEPEGVFFWGNTLHTSTNGGDLYRFIFR